MGRETSSGHCGRSPFIAEFKSLNGVRGVLGFQIPVSGRKGECWCVFFVGVTGLVVGKFGLEMIKKFMRLRSGLHSRVATL